MKKLILFCLVVACSSLSVSAQKYWDASRPDHRFTFGVRAGGNISKFYADTHNDFLFAPGVQIGLSADANIIRSLSITTGVFYIQKNVKLEANESDASVVRRLNPAYIEIPLLLSYRIPLSDTSQFQFNAGCYYAMGLTDSAKETFESLIKKKDMGISLGVAVTYSHYYVGVNYERSLLNISRDDESVQNATKWYNGSVVLSLGYNF